MFNKRSAQRRKRAYNHLKNSAQERHRAEKHSNHTIDASTLVEQDSLNPPQTSPWPSIFSHSIYVRGLRDRTNKLLSYPPKLSDLILPWPGGVRGASESAAPSGVQGVPNRITESSNSRARCRPHTPPGTARICTVAPPKPPKVDFLRVHFSVHFSDPLFLVSGRSRSGPKRV